MSASSPLQRWEALPSSSLVRALRQDEEIEDVVALSAAEAREWLQRLSLPVNWRVIEPPDVPEQPMARLAISEPDQSGQWEAADTISVFSYTGWPTFYDVFHNADGSLRALNAINITTKALPVPPIQWTAALRSCGIAPFGDRSVWLQQSHYVAGSERPHAGRLVVHSLLVDADCVARLAEDIARLSDTVYQGFTTAVGKERNSN